MKTKQEVYSDLEKKPENKMDYLHGWLFTYNSLNSMWRACLREDSNELFNDFKSDKVISSSRVETLQELIIKTGGDINKLNKLIK